MRIILIYDKKWKSVKDRGYKIEIWFKETLEKYEK
jgi:hypothetical protein